LPVVGSVPVCRSMVVVPSALTSEPVRPLFLMAVRMSVMLDPPASVIVCGVVLELVV